MNGPSSPFGDPMKSRPFHTEVTPVDQKLLEEAKKKIKMMEERQRARDAARKSAYTQPITPPVLRPSIAAKTDPKKPPHEPDEPPEVRRVDGSDGKVHWERVDEKKDDEE